MGSRREPETAQAEVLHIRNLGESDRVVELMTDRFGRIQTIARGARRSKKRFGGVLDLFVSLSVDVVTKGELWPLSAATATSHRMEIRGDLQRFGRANLLVECVRVLAAEESPSGLMFRSLRWGLDCLQRGDLAGSAACYPRFLKASGLLGDAWNNDAVGEVMRGRPCTSLAVATAVENIALGLVENQQGRPLRARSFTSAMGR